SGDRGSAYFSLHQRAEGLRLVVSSPEPAPRRARVRRLARAEYYGTLISKQLRAHLRDGKPIADGIGAVLREIRRGGPRGLALKLRVSAGPVGSSDAYQDWIAANDTLTATGVRSLYARLRALPRYSFAI